MNSIKTAIVLLISGIVAHAQVGRIELMTRAGAHAAPRGIQANASAPEISADGRFVLFISEAQNLVTNSTPLPAPNLFLIDRVTLQSTLVSVGLNGAPANDTIAGYEFSANGRRVLFETSATNIVANDTNNASDVFLRDLDLNQTFLVTASTNGGVADAGGFDASMSADGNRVVFTSSSHDLARNDTNIYGSDIFFRDLAERRTELVSVWTNGFSAEAFSQNPSISADGNIVAFDSSRDLTTADFIGGIFVRNLHSAVTVRTDANLAGNFYAPLMSRDGSYVVFSSNRGTNLLIRYQTATGFRELIASNTIAGAELHPSAVSSDGETIIYTQGYNFIAWREGQPARAFPYDPQGSLIPIVPTSGPIELSGDGRFAVFMSSTQGLTSDRTAPGYQVFFYDLIQDRLQRIALDNSGAGLRDDAPPFPVISNDGSVVIFSADNGEAQNLYAWDRASSQSTLLTTGVAGYFANSAAGGSSFSEYSAISDDSSKFVYASLTPADDIADTNKNWDVFVLDRTTGHRTTVSIRSDGTATGNAASYRPIISGDGNVVAFFSRATNLVSNTPRLGPGLYVHDLRTGVTRAVLDSNGVVAVDKMNNPSLSFDGRVLGFETRTPLDPRDANTYLDVYRMDTATGETALVSFDSSGTTAGDGDSTYPLVSADGLKIAFRTRSFNLGASGFYNQLVVRFSDGTLKVLTPASGAHAAPPFDRFRFNRAGNRILFAGFGLASSSPLNYFIYDFQTNSTTTACIDCADASMSEDGRWIAFLRGRNPALRRDIFLADRVTGAQIGITTNSTRLANGISSTPRVTDDGRFVIFQSLASNLVTNDSNQQRDLFLFTRTNSQIRLITRGLTGQSARGASQRPLLSLDNRFVLFKSFASDLVPHDFNGAPDIFAAYLPIVDADKDGLEDAWEIDSFASLSHTGSLDTDGDGLTDAMEFQAASNPSDPASALKLLAISAATDGQLQVRWQSVPGHAYRIQTRSDFNTGSWRDIIDPVTADAFEISINIPLPPEPSRIFARVILAD